MEEKNKIEIDIPETIMTLWSLSGMFNSSYFDSEKDMLIEYKKRQEESEKIDIPELDDNADFLEKMSRGSAIIAAALPVVKKYEYLGQFLGKNDVFKKTTYDKKGKEKVSFITCGIDTDHYSYLVIDSRRGPYWNGEIGSLSEVYNAFRERGIEFNDDIYFKLFTKHLEKLGKQLKKDYPRLDYLVNSLKQ